MLEIKVPPSKSLSNRALLLGLYGDLFLHDVLLSVDTEVMLATLPKLGVNVDIVSMCGPAIDVKLRRVNDLAADRIDLNTENAGTATRFLTAALAFGWDADFNLDGNDRMRQRPIAELVAALSDLGADIEYRQKEGYLPLLIKSRRDGSGERSCKIGQKLSSQYLSGLLLAAPFWPGRTLIERQGEVVSQSYIELTLALLADFGIVIKQDGGDFAVNGSNKLGISEYWVEADWSSASYWLARLVLEGKSGCLLGLRQNSRQGDKGFWHVLSKAANVAGEFTESGLLVKGSTFAGKLNFPDLIDCRDFPDAAMTLAIVIAVSGQKVELTGLANLRIKECDRLEALNAELTKLGVRVGEKDDGLVIEGIAPAELRPAVINTYDDHRMAMCFAVLQRLQPGITILDPDCVRKTYPSFWDEWAI